MGSILGQNHAIAKDITMHNNDSHTQVVTIKGLIVCYVCSVVGSLKRMGLRTCAGLVPCCGQDGYRTQVPQTPIETTAT